MIIRRLDDRALQNLEGDYLEMLSIDMVIIDKLNEIIDYINEKKKN